MFKGVPACVKVCVRERERKTDREKEKVKERQSEKVSKRLLVFCVTRKHSCSVLGKIPSPLITSHNH